MKLPLTIEVLGASSDDLKALAGKLPSAGGLSMKPFKDSLMFWKLKGFEISGASVPDSVNPKADYWPLDERTRKDLASILTAFRALCPRIFTVYCSPAGELPRRESDIQLDELLGMIAEGQIGHRVLYRVRELPPKILDDTQPETEGK
jgi:hypothetical protein